MTTFFFVLQVLSYPKCRDNIPILQILLYFSICYNRKKNKYTLDLIDYEGNTRYILLEFFDTHYRVKGFLILILTFYLNFLSTSAVDVQVDFFIIFVVWIN